jgi:outer membrane lipoprotein-sorting protein
MKKLILLLIVTFAIISFSGCSKETSDAIDSLKTLAEVSKNTADVLKDKEANQAKVDSMLKNYSIKLVASNGNKFDTLIEQKNDKGYLINGNQNIFYIDYAAKKFYTIDKEKKNGMAMPLTDSNADMKSLAGGMGFAGISAYLFVFDMYRIMGAKESGSEKVNGRATTVYELKKDGDEVRIWYDDEYGICMKYAITENGKTKTMEVKDAKFGNATIDVIDLSQYKIVDMSSPDLQNMLKK